MLNLFFQGFIIGLVVSAPMGPLGIVCIQRTISRGRMHGMVSGLGATTSDLLYALLVGFGMSFVVDFIESYQLIIQIVGSIILIAFGIGIFRSNPVKNLSRNTSNNKESYLSDYVSAFGLCISNPMIIFLFIGLFARFQTFSTDQSIWQNGIEMLGILIGGFLWWTFLTMLVSLFRSRFNVRGLWVLNKITGSLLILIGIFGSIMSLLGKSI